MVNDTIYKRVRENPKFNTLTQKRRKLGWQLSAVILTVYYAFILSIAFAPSFLGTKIGSGVMTLGIPVGIGIILLAFALTGIYVKRANSEFDALTAAIKEEARGDE